MTNAAAVADTIESELAPLSAAVSHAWWELNVAATDENERRRVELETALSDFLSDGDRFAAIEAARAEADGPCPAQARPAAARVPPAADTGRSPIAHHRARGVGRDAVLADIAATSTVAGSTRTRSGESCGRATTRASAGPRGRRRRPSAPRWPTTSASSLGFATGQPTPSASGTGSPSPWRWRRWTRTG